MVKSRKFIHGHNGKFIPRTKEYRKKISDSLMGHTFSQETKDKIRKTLLRGRAQVSSQSKLRLTTRKWQKIRKLCYERDNWTCQKCGVKCVSKDKKVLSRTIQCHHKVRWLVTQDDSLENLITLCVKCHRIIENQYE